jgi:hypothetical protein
MTICATGPISQTGEDATLALVSIERTECPITLSTPTYTIPADVDNKCVLIVLPYKVLNSSSTSTTNWNAFTAMGLVEMASYLTASSGNKGGVAVLAKRLDVADQNDIVDNVFGSAFSATAGMIVYLLRFNRAVASITQPAAGTGNGQTSGNSLGTQTVNVSAGTAPIFKCAIGAGDPDADSPCVLSGTLVTNGVVDTVSRASDVYEYQATGTGVNRTVILADTSSRRMLASAGMQFNAA